MSIVGVVKLNENAVLPEYATELSACADIRAFFPEYSPVTAYGPDNVEKTLLVVSGEIEVLPMYRCLIPTGLSFDIPEGCSLRTHPRSGLSLKQAITVICGEGVIDEDYQKQLYIPVINLSAIPVTIRSGDRLAQIELVRDARCSFQVVTAHSPKDSSRTGGFGHSGVR